jgi:hypothetical protein
MSDIAMNVSLGSLIALLGLALLAIGFLYVVAHQRTRASEASRQSATRRGYRTDDRREGLPMMRSPKLAGDTAARPTEDDIAKAKLGEQGVPGQPPKKAVMSADELQIPRIYDPGHTA